MYERVRRLLAKQLEISPDLITEDTDIVEDLGADSLDVVELIASVEEECGLVFTEEGAADLKKVRDVAAYIEKQM